MNTKNDKNISKPFLMELNKFGTSGYFVLTSFVINTLVAGTMSGLIWSDSFAAIFPFGDNTPAR